ncbi:MAG TPA: hypothetical protein VGK67_05850 [Myxococcales bacterium]
MELPSVVWQGRSPSGWINGRGWDLRWLVGSALVVPLVLLAVWAGASNDAVNLGVTAIIGGPHLFSTYTATYLDSRFRRSHRLVLLLAALAVPSFVVYWAIHDYEILISTFLFMASLHVLQQNAYLSDVYRLRVGRPEPRWSRWVDYGVLMTSIYPLAAYKLVRGEFTLGHTRILIPQFLLVPATYYAVFSVFFALLAVWLAKTAREWRRGEVNRPKTLLIAVTTFVAFVVPMAEQGGRLELAFQGVNAWHSIQYLGIVWLIQQVRSQQGLVGSRAVRWMSVPGKPWRFWGGCFAVTSAVLVGVAGLSHLDPWHLRFQQYYAMFVLSPLLVHYVVDGYVFATALGRQSTPDTMPYVVPATV